MEKRFAYDNIFVYDTKQENPANVGSCWLCEDKGIRLEYLSAVLAIIKTIYNQK
jgi:hypothetical protein